MPALREGYLNIGDPLETAELVGALVAVPPAPDFGLFVLFLHWSSLGQLLTFWRLLAAPLVFRGGWQRTETLGTCLPGP